MRALEQRFWKKVEKSPDCWEWRGAVDAKGRGRILHRGKNDHASRVSWLIHFGKIPTGKWVLHRCDNPLYIKPNHLFLGTVVENSADMVQKRRHAKHGVTHCKHGHRYMVKNTSYSLTRYGKPYRVCRTCANQAQAKYMRNRGRR